MARKKIDTNKLNTRRLELISKGYLTQQEVREFVAEGLENCSNVILAKRILKFIGLSVKDIEIAAKLESRGI